MKRQKKLYKRPKKAYEKIRMEDENKLVEKYGLKNKREIWKTIAKIGYFRRRAKALAKAPLSEQNDLFTKLQGIGLPTTSIAEVLALSVEDLLKRRLTSVIATKGLVYTTKQARQLVVHKKVFIAGNVVNKPSYIVPVSEESQIIIKGFIKEQKKQESDEDEEDAEESDTESESESESESETTNEETSTKESTNDQPAESPAEESK